MHFNYYGKVPDFLRLECRLPLFRFRLNKHFHLRPLTLMDCGSRTRDSSIQGFSYAGGMRGYRYPTFVWGPTTSYVPGLARETCTSSVSRNVYAISGLTWLALTASSEPNCCPMLPALTNILVSWAYAVRVRLLCTGRLSVWSWSCSPRCRANPAPRPT